MHELMNIVVLRVADRQIAKKTPKPLTTASIRFVEDTVVENTVVELSPEQELDAIEQDETLQSILAKQEDDIALTEQEVDYYNDKMERHQVLSAELGLDEDDDASDSDESNSSDSEDDLWDKLDRPNFSNFEEKE